MKTKLLTCVSTMDRPGIQKLKHSLDLFNYDYEIMVDPEINWAYGGWHNFYKWCLKQEQDPNGYTHFIYTDGFDTLALGPMDEAIKKYQSICPDMDVFLYPAEKNCYPQSHWDQEYYKQFNYEPHQKWRFLNGGQFMTSVKKFIQMYQAIDINVNSQEWGAKMLLWHNQDGKIKLDINCQIFQSTSFRDDPNGPGDDFSIEHTECFDVPQTRKARLFNNFTKTKPVFAHANGAGVNLLAEFQFVYDILGL